MAALRETWFPTVHFTSVRCRVGTGKGSQFTQTQAQVWQASQSWEMLSERCQEDWGRGAHALRPSRSIFIPPFLHTPGRVKSSCGLRPLAQCDHTLQVSLLSAPLAPKSSLSCGFLLFPLSTLHLVFHPGSPQPSPPLHTFPPVSLGFHHWRQQRLSSMRRKKKHCLLLSETRVRGLKSSGDVTPGILTDFPEASRRPLLPSSAARLPCPLACSPVEQPLVLELLVPTHVWPVGFHPWCGPQESRYF